MAAISFRLCMLAFLFPALSHMHCHRMHHGVPSARLRLGFCLQGKEEKTAPVAFRYTVKPDQRKVGAGAPETCRLSLVIGAPYQMSVQCRQGICHSVMGNGWSMSMLGKVLVQQCLHWLVIP